MSYNRRNTRSQAPPPQVTYHQSAGRPGPPNPQPYQMNKPGYQPQQPIQQSPQQVQQQVHQQVHPQVQQTIQQQQQQQHQQVPAPPAPPAPPALLTPQAYKNPAVQTPVKPAQQPLAPQTPVAIKEPTTPTKTLQDQDKSNNSSLALGQEGDEMETEASDVKKWQKRPKSTGYKVNKVLKRRRKNARFRKLLTPKNAIMVLNELQPGVSFDSREVTNAFNQITYVVSFEVDGQQFTGEGTSKGSAKQAAAEAAVKALILKKINESKRKDDTEPMETVENADESQGEGSENTSNGGRRRELPEDEVPWGSLASFALYRLFTEWESQGTYVPFPPGTLAKAKISMPPSQALSPVASVGSSTVSTPVHKPKKAITNLQGTHPVTLVGRLWPGSVFSELSRDGQPPNMTFVMGVTIEGKAFTGTAKNKKDAKKECAKSALAGMGVAWEEQPAQTA